MGTELNTESMLGLDSEEEDSFLSMLDATVGLWVQSTDDNDSDSSELGLKLDLGLMAMSKSVKE